MNYELKKTLETIKKMGKLWKSRGKRYALIEGFTSDKGGRLYHINLYSQKSSANFYEKVFQNVNHLSNKYTRIIKL